MGQLTDIELRALVKAGRPVAGRADGDGLTFTLSKTGTAAWVLRYSVVGRARELTLGRYPDLSLAMARKRATKERARIADGIDPAAEKRREKLAKATAQSFKDLAEDYMKRAAPALSSATRTETRRYLDKDIVPRLGGLPIKAVTPAEVVHFVETIAARSPTVARRSFQILSTIFSHGLAKHLCAANPCAGLKPAAIIGQ